MAYLPAPGIVKLRMSCVAENEEVARKLVADEEQKLTQIIGEYIWGYDDETIEGNVGALLLQYGETVATAESCTGGNISRMITSISGSSAYYWGSVVSYDNSVKINELNVSANDIEQYGVCLRRTIVLGAFVWDIGC